MIFTLTMNPCLDRYIYLDKLVVDDTIRARKVVDYPAGKGIDVSRVIKELGGVSIAVALVGGDTGRKLEEMLDKEGVIYSSIRVNEETRMNVILESKNGQYRISMPGKRISKKKLQTVLEVLNALVRENDIVVVSGSLPKGISPDFYTGIIFALKQWGAKVFFDADGEKLKAGLIASPDVIKPNIHEFSRIAGEKFSIEDKRTLIKEARIFLEKYELSEILLTLGAKGSLLISYDKVYFSPPLKLPVKSAVGAGDSFLAAYVLKIAEGFGRKEAFKWANAAGNAAVMTPGTQLCRKRDVEELLSKIEIYELN
ncbi:1-phosphofructokinase family hexose kinase [Thermosipho ferrireducens]|uniref:1-phosphofructokinase family hexose kinase n=1 Tax=Thermosipho ferrireducens TaxID=2571116 RepID=A0ABX7S6H2_9BACT|nr:1-phosphofructokinase family hexose kinase [Thermosipho ferrireducens]QTA37431.1 1-phosphofructokinase family hexose kinase [Thermosipho ferrireducens]